MPRRQRHDTAVDLLTQQWIPTAELAIGNAVLLDCISSKGEPCQTDLVVARISRGRVPKTLFTVTANNSRAALTVGEDYILEDPHGLGIGYGAAGMIGVDQFIPFRRPRGHGIRRTSFVIGLTLMTEDSILSLGDVRQQGR